MSSRADLDEELNWLIWLWSFRAHIIFPKYVSCAYTPHVNVITLTRTLSLLQARQSYINMHAPPRYCWWLVDNGIFKKVKISFLLVGHTHENIDQLFSRMAISLRKSDVWTIQDLASVGRQCFTPTPLVAFVEAGYDWDKYCKGADDVQEIHDISFSHNFKVWSLNLSFGYIT